MRRAMKELTHRPAIRGYMIAMSEVMAATTAYFNTQAPDEQDYYVKKMNENTAHMVRFSPHIDATRLSRSEKLAIEAYMLNIKLSQKLIGGNNENIS